MLSHCPQSLLKPVVITTNTVSHVFSRLAALPLFAPLLLVQLLLLLSSVPTHISTSPPLIAMAAPTNAPRATGPTMKPWADGPIPLLRTPQYETKKTDLFTTGATHMALLHNSIFRGYNSIWQQATHIREEDKEDFIGYCQTWYNFVKSHHDDEEKNLFPRVEELLKDKTIFAETHKEHESFIPGLFEFDDYLNQLGVPGEFSGTKLRAIMAKFVDAFQTHFHNEITTIANLAKHPACPRPGTPAAEEAAAVFKTWGKATVTNAGVTDVVPFFLLNLDATYEDGMWANWPPMPAAVKWAMVNVVGSWWGSRWRFSSCGTDSKPRPLFALQFPEVKETGKRVDTSASGGSLRDDL